MLKEREEQNAALVELVRLSGGLERGREGGREKRETATQTHHNITRIERKSEMLL